MKLLNPGPVTLPPRVRAALAGEDCCHREPEFAALQADVRRRLAEVYPEAAADYTAVLLAGSGTAAVEAMAGSLVPRGGRALVVANGVYGERMAAILEAQGKTVFLARAAWDAPMDLAAAEAILRRERDLSHVLAVHLETTTGRLNDLPALAALCRRHGVPLLLDCVSSFGAEEIDFAGWNVEACAATANKCLHGAPGVSFVLARREALRGRPSGATGVYLDLFRHHPEQERGSCAFTPAVPACRALGEALQELEDAGGWRARRCRYRALSRRVYEGLRELGIEPLLGDAPSSAALTAYRVPPGWRYADLHDALKEAGFILYAGQGRFEGEIFRVAVMGDLGDDDVTRLLAAFQHCLSPVG
jgi:2-aminoethylphosphonate-pyruvate transaminase